MLRDLGYALMRDLQPLQSPIRHLEHSIKEGRPPVARMHRQLFCDAYLHWNTRIRTH